MKNTFISNHIKKDPWVIFFELFFIIQLILIFIFNLTHLKYEAGFDSSAAMSQAMEIWNQKTIFLKNWDYQATLGLDSVIIPASIFYGITHNIFVSYGLADCLGVILYIYVFRDILMQLKTSKLARMIAYVILLTPYSLEPLGYMPMMFTGAAYYVIKVLIPIMLIDIMLKLHNNISFKKFIPLLVIYFISLYLTALSCGLYLMICGILPIIIYELYYAIGSGRIRNILNTQLILLGISIAVYGLGYLSAKLYGSSLFTSDMLLTQVNDFVDNFFKCIIGIAELFGALPSQEICVTSVFGIHYLSHMAAFIICISLIVITIKKAKPFSSIIKISNKTTNETNTSSLTSSNMVIGMVSCVIAVNMAVLFLTNTTYGSESFEFRYHLIPIVAGFLIVCIAVNNLIAWLCENNNKLLSHAILALIGVIWILCNAVFVHYFTLKNTYNISSEIVSFVENDTDCNTLYFIGDNSSEVIETARIARLIETDLIIVDGTSIGSYIGWGASNKHYEPVEGLDKLIIACTKDTYYTLEDRYTYSMKKIKQFDDYILYELTDPLTYDEYDQIINNKDNIYQ